MANEQVHTSTMNETKLIPMYRVLLHNDDANSMAYVVECLYDVFRFDAGKCVDIMMEAHQSGCALCVVEPQERAEHHQELLQARRLVSTIEPE